MASPSKRRPRDRDEAERDESPPTYAPLRPRKVWPKSEGQQAFLDAIDANDLTFGVGPAGSGKTRLAVAKAVEALAAGDVNRIVLVRPCIGLGRTVGFLKGTLEEKVGPYLRPLLDELNEVLPAAQVAAYVQKETIELSSLEYVRGRTFKHSFVILDEAQNATRVEMKAILTRLGEGSTYVITGDVSRDERGHLEQSDLHPSEQGALEHYLARFGDIPGVGVARMSVVDVVRHPLVRLFLERGL